MDTMSSSDSDSELSTSAPETPAKAAKSRHLASATKKQVKTPKQQKKRPTMSDRKKRAAGAALTKTKATKQGKTEASIPNKKGVNKKAPNFTTEEDVFLCRAFVNISQDGARGTDRKAEHFWEQVREAFVQLYEEEAEVKGDGQGAARDYNSLRNRFQKHIQKDMNEFNFFYAKAVADDPSGVTDFIELGVKYYEDYYYSPEKDCCTKKFRFHECIAILHQMPKFNPMLPQEADDDSAAGKKANKISNAMGSALTRPIGAKAAKKAEKDEFSAASVNNAKVNAMNRLADANATIAVSQQKMASTQAQMARINDRKNKLDMVRLYMDLGQPDKANEMMSQIEQDEARYAMEQHTLQFQAAAARPTDEVTITLQETTIAVGDDDISRTSSGAPIGIAENETQTQPMAEI